MKKNLITTLSAVFFLALLFSGCQKQPSLKVLTPKLPDVAYTYPVCVGGGSFCNDNTPSDNRTTANGATLGRLLFYDPRLSLNNTVSCASCHKQANSFADNSAASEGYEGMKTPRNSPGFTNESLKGAFFWDGRATSLEEMVLMPVQNHLEMGMEKLDAMERKIASVSYYPDLFAKAFGTSEVTHKRIAFALAQFVRAAQSSNSKFDNNALNETETKGLQVFSNNGCSNCHAGNNFGGSSVFGGYHGNAGVAGAANIGLDEVYTDKGIRNLTGNEAQDGAFIIPSLRNLTLTAPYMHDGRYNTIEEVIEHYNTGIKLTPGLDHQLQDTVTGIPVKMNMTDDDKKALAAFLRAISDNSLTTDKRFSNPFE